MLLPHFLLSSFAFSWQTAIPRRAPFEHARATYSGSRLDLSAANDDQKKPHLYPKPIARIYDGPILMDTSGIVGGICLQQLGIDLFVAPSVVAPGTLGLFCLLSEDVESAILPSMSLLSGYSREGIFLDKDEGDKTVAFAIPSLETAVFYERELMSVIDALELAASSHGKDGACGLAGHVLVQNEDGEVEIYVDNEDPTFKRFYVPALLNGGEDNLAGFEGDDEADSGAASIGAVLSVQNIGQFCNDLAWSSENPPKSKEVYEKKSEMANLVQLVWRLEFDPSTNCLVGTWPVSTLSNDVTFQNSDTFMELGTRYGWNYWQASVDIDSLGSNS